MRISDWSSDVCSSDLRRADQGTDPFVAHALGGRRQGQSRQELAGIVVNAGGNAAHAKLELFVVARITVAAHQGEVALELIELGNAVAGGSGQPGTHRIGPNLARIADGEKQFARGRKMQRRAPAHGRAEERRVGKECGSTWKY